jgi:hypothetical protein
MGFLKSVVNSYKGRKDRLQEKMLIKIFIKQLFQMKWSSFVVKYYRAEKEEAQKVHRDERGKGCVAGRAGDAAAGEARGEQEARQKRQAQTQPG